MGRIWIAATEVYAEYEPSSDIAYWISAKIWLDPPESKRRLMTEEEVDWSKCEDVESVPGRLSGAWVIKGTRVPAQAVVDNARAGCTAEEIATEIFELPLERVRGVLRFAKVGTLSKG
jgi:uncharacterized protein (DUF433 family)